MNCRDIEPLLLAERDGVLTNEQHAALAKHFAACPACQQLRAHLSEATQFLKMDAANVAVPDADTEWRELRVQLQAEKARPAKKRRLAPVIWFATPLAAAAAIAVAFLVVGRPVPPPAVVVPAPLVASTSVSPFGADPIGADDSASSTMAYVDQESGWLVVWSTDPNATKHSG